MKTKRPKAKLKAAPRRCAPVSGSAADSVSDRRTALKFVHKWLWESRDRRTVDQEWPDQYVNDAVSMILAYQKQQNDKLTP